MNKTIMFFINRSCMRNFATLSKTLTNSPSRIIRNGSFRRVIRENNQITNTPPVYSYKENNNSSIIKVHDPVATTILNEPTIIIERQIEFMNVFLGFEQANRYAIMDVNGNKIASMMERDFSITKAIMRQFYRLHRPFLVDVFDNWGNVIMTIKRPFSFINSHIKTIVPPSAYVDNGSGSSHYHDGKEGTIVGETIQNWHLWRRRYELFQKNGTEGSTFDQFGKIDAPFLSFDFPVTDADGKIMASVDRNWVGLGREMFTDTGVYVVRFDSQRCFNDIYPTELLSSQVLTLDQRAVLLANAVSIDFDYFSRHSRQTGGFLSFGGGYDE
ncbi:Aim25p [Saccharomyces paradoxus]|uniref:Phospholipid scramblase n=1 Tax=Saccharomyces paradoxus TaxID=27291 RepID=A0A8B8UUB5_SACPA|nr:Aim25 [Saccharomyces paradoxus]QHS74327.1 Aim25 [Saccharomyces paradoxus]